MNDRLKEVLLMIGAISILISLIVASLILSHEDTKKQCNNYEKDTKIDTQVVGSMWETNTCYVKLIDGTRVKLEDFSIATIKQPRMIK